MHNRDALVQIKYTGATPGADTNFYTLFDTTTLGGARMVQSMGLKKFYLSLTCSANGEIRVEKSHDRGVTWIQVGADTAITAAANDDQEFEFNIEAFPDFRIRWENTAGGAQDPWVVSMALTDERADT